MKKFNTILTVLTFIAALIILCLNPVNDLCMCLFKIMIIISSLIIFFIKTNKIFYNNIFFNINYFASVFFLFMILNSKDFLSLYFNIELFSISLYFLISKSKTKISLVETLKYMFSSIFASSIMLLGTAFLYGFCGSIKYDYIDYYIRNSSSYSFSTYIFPYLMIFSGLVFKLGILPFSRWMIDIFNNIDTKIVTYISIVPKIGILGALMNVLGSFITFETSFILCLLAIFTGLFGLFYGIKANSLKEIIVSSSYINISYILIGLAIYTKMSLSAMLFYLICYIFMNIGAFAGIISIEESKSDYGYFYKNKLFGICFGISIISLWGLPITSGFISKIYLLFSILNSGLLLLPIILAMFFIMCVSSCFYSKVIFEMFIKDNLKINNSNKIILYGSSFITFILGIFPLHIIHFCEKIVSYIN